MDLVEVERVRVARSRDQLTLEPGEVVIGGGTWFYSEPQPGITGIVDLTGMGWPALTVSDGGLEVATTCTLEELARFSPPSDWHAAALFAPAVEALLGSWKIHRIGTVGGNICTALPAGPMISLAVALDGVAVIWAPDGERRMPVLDFVTDVRTTALRPGELLRAIELQASTLRSRAAMRRISLASLGRSAALVIGRRDGDGSLAITVTAATPRPYQLHFDGIPSAAELAAAVDSIADWYDDPHGAPDWRRHMALRFAEELRVELAGAA